jgi:hypothetical protein
MSARARLQYGSADCAVCGWKMQGVGTGKNAMGVAARHANQTGHVATAVLEYRLVPSTTSEEKRR